LLTALVVGVAVAAHLWDDASVAEYREPDPAWWTILLVLCGTLPIYWRRTRPLVAGIVVVSAEVIGQLIGLGGAAFLGAVVAVYSIGAHAQGVRRTRTMTGITCMVIGLFVIGWLDGLSLLDEFVSTGVILITAFVLGDNLRRRRQHVADLAERAERAEREQGLQAERRVAAERTRIARDLHDVVAHSVSVMVIQAAAARRNLATSPDSAAEALEAIEATGRQTMTELRAILGVLREASVDPAFAPQPSLTGLEALTTGDELPVELTVEGDLRTVPESVSVTSYRLVQEALTNVRRHAGAVNSVAVRVEVGARDVTIQVSDNGRGAGVAASPDGFGIIGMRERVAAVGGTFEAGPRPGGGWRVRAVLPLDAGVVHRIAAGATL
jgi:signal transduction histidine kinase